MPIEPDDLKNQLLKQYNLIIDLVEQCTQPGAKRLMLTPELIRQLHGAAPGELGATKVGQFRTGSVSVRGSDHLPVPAEEVEQEVVSFCDYVNDQWDRGTALHLAAYVLWKLSWIHPFIDGNGRTARALSYLVLSARLGVILPGTPTIAEQIRHNRALYFDALQAADAAFKQGGGIDVGKLEVMLNEMLVQQLNGALAISEEVREHLDEIVDRRIRRAPAKVQQFFGKERLIGRSWAVGDYMVLQVGLHSAIVEAEKRHLAQGNAFPRLLAVGNASAPMSVRESERGTILRWKKYDASSGYAVVFEHNAAAVIENPSVYWKGADGALEEQWKAEGVLYTVRFGRQTTTERAADVFEFLIARHMMALGT